MRIRTLNLHQQQCCGAGAGRSRYFLVGAGAGVKMWRQKHVFYYFLTYFYMKRSRSRWQKSTVPGAEAGRKRTGSTTRPAVRILIRIRIQGVEKRPERKIWFNKKLQGNFQQQLLPESGSVSFKLGIRADPDLHHWFRLWFQWYLKARKMKVGTVPDYL